MYTYIRMLYLFGHNTEILRRCQTMALRIPWDIEEAVLMLDMLLKSIDGKLTRKEAIRQVSE